MKSIDSGHSLVNRGFRDIELIGLFIPYLLGLGVEIGHSSDVVFYILWPICMLYLLIRLIMARSLFLATLKKTDVLLFSAFCFFSLFSIVLHEGPLYYLTAYIIYTWVLFVYLRTAFAEVEEDELITLFYGFAFFAAVVQGITSCLGIICKLFKAPFVLQEGRFQGLFGNPNTQAIAAAGGILCALIAFLMMPEKRKKEIAMLLATAAFNAAAIVFSQGRGATLAICFSALVWLIFEFCEADRKNRVRMLVILLIVVILAAAAVIFIPSLNSAFISLWHRFFPENGKSISSSGRVAIWSMAVKQLNWKNIWLGIGPSNLAEAGAGVATYGLLKFSGVHNIPLQILVVHGLLAFVFCYAFFIKAALALITDAIKCEGLQKAVRVSVLLLFLLYTVEGLFGNPVFLVTSLGVNIVVMAATGSYLNEKRILP